MPCPSTVLFNRVALAAGLAAAVSTSGGFIPHREQDVADAAAQCQRGDSVLTIDRPVDRTVVGPMPLVEGTLARPGREVWTIVHPMAIATYFVQQSTQVHANCTWSVQVNIGRQGSVDVGKRFEIMTVIGPAAALRVGQQLPSWPAARYRSPIIQVVRGR
jgi:hypothetical protein